ncbi:hypothetical protein FQN60_009950 [Etheostoma spectabile]|uniref:Interleukin n=1 Tax=Etheostoma spectabile TaxID=54343 RepID=A0A5J5D7Q0_9PERO|nr:hypothetical protein FQN60_009950 [Etheostoma spectabile]
MNDLRENIQNNDRMLTTPPVDIESTCQDCASQPKENASTFFNRLESFVQKAIARLNMIQK